MADLSKIKVGDKLKLTATVTELFLGYPAYPVRVVVGNEANLLRPIDIEAAEHIPAPKNFKRGDWVKEAADGSSRIPEVRGGFVNYIGGGGKVFVAWPGCAAFCTYDPDELEPDEAPE